MTYHTANTINAPEECVRYAMSIEAPAYPCIRIILSHGTFVDLFEESFQPDNLDHAEMLALFDRAYAGEYSFSDADKVLLIKHLAPYLTVEWEKGVSNNCEGHFTTICADFPSFEDEYTEDAAVSATYCEPSPVLLLQTCVSDHHDANNAIFNWYMEIPDAETDFYETALAYRKADSLNPQIAEIIISNPADF